MKEYIYLVLIPGISRLFDVAAFCGLVTLVIYLLNPDEKRDPPGEKKFFICAFITALCGLLSFAIPDEAQMIKIFKAKAAVKIYDSFSQTDIDKTPQKLIKKINDYLEKEGN